MKKTLSIILLVLTVFTFVGCSGQAPNVPVKDIITNIENEVKEVSDLTEVDLKSEEMSELDKETIKAFGINPDDVEEGILKFPMINLQADEVIIIKAKDESKVPVIEEALKKHVENQLAVFENYVQENYDLVKNHILKSEGNYTILIISKDAEKIEQIFDNALK